MGGEAMSGPNTISVGGRLGYLAAGLAVLSLAGFVVWFEAFGFGPWLRSAGWGRTEGTVTRSAVVETRVTVRQRASRAHEAGVSYTYTVDGREHHGSAVCFGPRRTFAFLARAQAGSYPAGEKVDVYYDPADPGSAVLSRSVSFSAMPFLLLALAGGWLGARLTARGVVPEACGPATGWVAWADQGAKACAAAAIILCFGLTSGLL
jgi:hypothetical protein